ncbi:unnamed protein product [Discula destructiva]
MTFAILGATGQVGSSILQVLTHSQPESKINVLVRSRAKLERMAPTSASSPPVNVFEGPISNVPLLTACIRDTTAVFLAVATATNVPHSRIAVDQVEAVVAALETLRSERGARQKLPTLVLLSSAETEEKLVLSIPLFVRRLLFQCNYWIYTDLIAAEAYLRARSGWIDAVYFKPGGISHDVQTGHVLSEDESMTFVSFLDVAAGMVECAVDGERWSGKSVSVLATRKARFPAHQILVGLPISLLGTYFPWLYTKLF